MIAWWADCSGLDERRQGTRRAKRQLQPRVVSKNQKLTHSQSPTRLTHAMRKKVIVLGGFALVLATALLVRWFSHPSEPYASGRSFTYWFRGLAILPQDPAADQAIRDMGTNCLPCLLTHLSRPPTNSPTSVQKRVADLVENKVPWLRRPLLWDRWRPLTWDEWERACGRAFWLLGPVADQAIPELERLLEDPVAGGKAAWVLANRGTNAWPSLLRALAHRSPAARIHALLGLPELGTTQAVLYHRS